METESRERGIAVKYYEYQPGMLCPMCACRLEEDEACNICGYSHVVSLGTYRAKVAKRFEAVRYE